MKIEVVQEFLSQRGFKEVKKRREFQHLEREVARGVKSISRRLKLSFKAAGRSRSAAKLKRRMGRVVKEGKKQGKIEAQKAQAAAVVC